METEIAEADIQSRVANEIHDEFHKKYNPNCSFCRDQVDIGGEG